MRKKYPSDITREQFEQIAHLLEGVRKKTRPRTVDLYEVLQRGAVPALQAVASGECCPKVFPNGARFIHISRSGAERKPME